MRVVCVGGSDAGISAALRARELDPDADVIVVLADAYPNHSICGIPYLVSGDVVDWRDLAHRSHDDLQATGMRLRINTVARAIDPASHHVYLTGPDRADEALGYDRLVIATGATPVQPAVDGLIGAAALGAGDGVHLLHTMGDTFSLLDSIDRREPETALLVGAGYIGLEMAEALTNRGIRVTQVEQLPHVLPTIDPELATVVEAELVACGVELLTGTRVTQVELDGAKLRVTGDPALSRKVDLVLVVVGVRPDTALAQTAGVRVDGRGAIIVDEHMRTGVPHVFAAGDCVHTHHRLLPEPTYLPLGTTAHKQGRVAGENAVGGDRAFAGSVGTQVVKVFIWLCVVTQEIQPTFL